jgi:hypothetical protein
VETALFSSSVHDLVHALIRNSKLLREFGLRNASSVSGTDDDIPFAGGESWIRPRGSGIELFEDVRHGGID